MAEFFEQVRATVAATLNNQVVTGGFILMMIGSAIALARNLPYRLMDVLVRQFTISVDVVSGDALFVWLTTWLDAHPYSRTARRITASSANCSDAPVAVGSKEDRPRVLFTPAPGNHFLWLGSRPLWLARERKEQPTGRDGWTTLQETITIRMIGRDPTAVRKILEDARDLVYRDERVVGMHVCRWGDWYRIHEVRPRALDSVVLPEGMMDDLVGDASTFLASEDWYTSRGIPWRRGYLLEGTPGSGKTSAIAAIAGHLGLDLYMCSVAGSGLDDERLVVNLLNVNPRSVVLLEDVDCLTEGREMKEEGVTFAGLLNALDGVASKRGVITFLTTNHSDKLDPALLRNGRVDRRFTFGTATAEQAARFFTHFYGAQVNGEASTFGNLAAGKSMAELQGLLIEHRDDCRAALAALALHPDSPEPSPGQEPRERET